MMAVSFDHLGEARFLDLALESRGRIIETPFERRASRRFLVSSRLETVPPATYTFVGSRSCLTRRRFLRSTMTA